MGPAHRWDGPSKSTANLARLPRAQVAVGRSGTAVDGPAGVGDHGIDQARHPGYYEKNEYPLLSTNPLSACSTDPAMGSSPPLCPIAVACIATRQSPQLQVTGMQKTVARAGHACCLFRSAAVIISLARQDGLIMRWTESATKHLVV